MARVLKWLGFSTEVCNYIDDTGVQVVDVVTAFLYLDPPYYSEEVSDFEASGQRLRRINLLTISAGIFMLVFRTSLRRIQDYSIRREDNSPPDRRGSAIP